MMISTRGRYAMRILVDLAEQQGENYITLKELSDSQEISEKYLESIVKVLVKAGILEGLRGKGGGYRLGQPAETINVYDVLTLTEGNMNPVACLTEDSKPCPRASHCRTLPLWEGLDQVVAAYLKGYSVKDLVSQCKEGKI